jgi:hypothetical protein
VEGSGRGLFEGRILSFSWRSWGNLSAAGILTGLPYTLSSESTCSLLLLHRLIWWVGTDVSEEPTAFPSLYTLCSVSMNPAGHMGIYQGAELSPMISCVHGSHAIISGLFATKVLRMVVDRHQRGLRSFQIRKCNVPNAQQANNFSAPTQ